MKKVLSFVYGLVNWVGFLGIFMYMIGFLGEFLVPKTVNSGIEGPMGQAILINLLLIALFGIHHSIAARPGFKKWVTQHCPQHLERSTYVLISNVFMILILWQWQPITQVVWHVDSPLGRTILYSLFGFGWFLVVLSSFLINHFDLFGIRQVYLNLVGKEYTSVPFKLTFLYKIVRNPLMLGWYLAFWSTPHMTVGHFVFASGLSAYGFIGILCEEKDHAEFLGEQYKEYKEKTPMVLPFPKLGKTGKCPFHF